MRKEYRKQKARERFFRYIHTTWKNKLLAIAMVCAGTLGVVVEKDGTALVFMMMIAVPMFFSRRDWTI